MSAGPGGAAPPERGFLSGRRRRHSGGGRGGGRWAPFISPPPPSSPCVEAGRLRRSGVAVTPAAPALQIQRVRRERGAAQPPRGTAPTPGRRQPRSTGAAGRGSAGSRVTKGRVRGWLERGAGELARSHRCGLGRGGSGTLGLPTGYAGRRSRSGAGSQPARGLRWEEGRPGWGRLDRGLLVPHPALPGKRVQNPMCAETFIVPCCRSPAAFSWYWLVPRLVANSKAFAALHQGGIFVAVSYFSYSERLFSLSLVSRARWALPLFVLPSRIF